MAGNLLDNAFMWARSTVKVSALRNDATVHILVDDDGPGLALAQREQVLRPGKGWTKPRPDLVSDCRLSANLQSSTAAASL